MEAILVDRSEEHTVLQYTKIRVESSYVDPYWAYLHQSALGSFHLHDMLLVSYS